MIKNLIPEPIKPTSEMLSELAKVDDPLISQVNSKLISIMAGEEDEEKRIMLRGMMSFINEELPYVLMLDSDEEKAELWCDIESVWNFDEARLFAEKIMEASSFWRWADIQDEL